MTLIEAVEKLRPLLVKAELAGRRTYITANLSQGDVAALREVIGECEKVLGYDDIELEHRNRGALICAEKLLEIAISGEHVGRFGCPVMNEVADRLVRLHELNAAREKQLTGLLTMRNALIGLWPSLASEMPLANPVPQQEAVKTADGREVGKFVGDVALWDGTTWRTGRG